MTRYQLFIPYAVLMLVISGCQTGKDNNVFSKENIGTVVGTGAGLLVGSQLGGGSGRQVAMIVGAISGGLLGRYIGARLDERDREALALETNAILDQKSDGEASYWQSQHSDATATITPVATTTKNETTTIKTSNRLVAVDNITPIQARYRTTSGVNIRSGPSTSNEKVGSLTKGTNFTAIGKTDNDWLVVSRQGVGVGYLYAPLAERFTPQQTAAKRTPDDNQAIDLDTIMIEKNDSQMAAFDLDGIEIEEQSVAYTTQCRTLNYHIESDGTKSTDEVEACQRTDGSWELV